MKKKYKKGEIAIIILKTIALSGAIVVCASMPGMALVLKMFLPKDDREKKKIVNSFYNLNKQGFIKKYKKNNKDIIEITEKGKKKLLQYNLQTMKLSPSKKWDNLWKVVIFDIPEKKKIARRSLSNKLKDAGFYQLQKSVFISPYECKDEIDFIGNYFYVRKYIKYMTVKDVEGSKKIKAYFKIK